MDRIEPQYGASMDILDQVSASKTDICASWGYVYIYHSVIIGGVFAAAMCLIPETLPRIVIARNARRLEANDADEIALMDMKVNIFKEIRFVTTMALRIMVTEPIVTFLAVYNGWAYGLLFLYLDGVFSVFVVNNNLSYVFHPSTLFLMARILKTQ